jgi:hypothetical protein
VSLLGQLTRSLRGDGARAPRYARRAARGAGLSLGTPRADQGRAVRALLWGALALVLFGVEAGLLVHVDLPVARVDVAVLLVVFAALELGAIEGVLAAFAVGYVADLFVAGPPGLCRFLAVALWIGVRVTSVRVQLPPVVTAVVFTFGAVAAYQTGLLALMQLAAGRAEGPGTIAWLSVVPHAALTAALAPLAFRGLGAIEARTLPS